MESGPDKSDQQPADEFVPVLLALVFEGGLAGLALTVGLFGFHAADQPLPVVRCEETLRPALVYGTAGSIPLIFLSLWSGWSRLEFFKQIRRSLDGGLMQMLAGISLPAVIIISGAAALGEELLFRWCLQGGFQAAFSGPYSVVPAIIVASTVFGACHALNVPYFCVATVVGIWLGLLMFWSGTWLAAALAHFLIDLFSLGWYTGHWPIPRALTGK